MELGSHDRRRHARCTVYEPCEVTVEGRKCSGAIVNISMGGAAIQLDVHLDVQPGADTPVALHIDRIGRIRAKVMRPLIDGIAVEFRIDRDQEKHLVAALMHVLDDYQAEDG